MTEQLQKKVERAIKLIQKASQIAAANGCPEIEVAYSGGKDSDVILELTKMAGVPYRAIHHCTTIDVAGTLKHVAENGVEIMRPKKSFLQLIAYYGFPSRMNRHCCTNLKEIKVLDYAILGIRAEESNKRKERYKEPEQCRVYSKKKKVRQYFPILDWTNDDIVSFITERKIKLHKLYYDNDGNIDATRRLGCMGCPLQSYKQRIKQFKQYPNMVKLYVRGGGNTLIITELARLQRWLMMVMSSFVLTYFAKEVISVFKKRLVNTIYLAQKPIVRLSLKTISI